MTSQRHDEKIDPAPLPNTASPAAGSESNVFSTKTEQAGFLDHLFLPRLTDRVEIRNASQPITLLFERQLHLGDVLTAEKMIILALLAGVLVLMPVVLIRHFKEIERAEVEHERSTYLATHDVLTHPEDYPSPSSIDLREWRALAASRIDGRPLLALIVGRKGLHLEFMRGTENGHR
ncbi:hypothetical protein [Pseudomonas sp. MPC6]|uniref:hypothetical protein n=1 Tax=unclassified Pseudomonas TaxID=196821 RepID=UPI001E3EA7CE|nr:hypothetical protein [Pseudomonas sp. MPC6]